MLYKAKGKKLAEMFEIGLPVLKVKACILVERLCLRLYHFHCSPVTASSLALILLVSDTRADCMIDNTI